MPHIICCMERPAFINQIPQSPCNPAQNKTYPHPPRRAYNALTPSSEGLTVAVIISGGRRSRGVLSDRTLHPGRVRKGQELREHEGTNSGEGIAPSPVPSEPPVRNPARGTGPRPRVPPARHYDRARSIADTETAARAPPSEARDANLVTPRRERRKGIHALPHSAGPALPASSIFGRRRLKRNSGRAGAAEALAFAETMTRDPSNAMREKDELPGAQARQG